MTSPNPTHSDSSDQKWMQHALKLAWRGQGFVEPNPMVGSVIVKNNQLLGQGYHEKFGEPHAEINAINDCKINNHDPGGADIYITLEPCAHHGKTPSCADALINADVKRVICAIVDPFDQVAGRGIAKLRNAGIHVDLMDPISSKNAQHDARELIAPFFTRIQHQRPYVIAKWAQTLDGRIATATGHSQWISNSHSRALVHQTRARVDAIMIGITTALNDDPSLTARPPAGSPIQRIAKRIIIDPKLKLPTNAKILTDHGPPVIIACAQFASPHIKNYDAQIIPLPSLPNTSSLLDLKPLFQQLASQHQMTNILVEGGGKLIANLLAQQLIDETLVFIAPKILGDPLAIPAINFTNTNPPQTIDDATPLRLIESKQLGSDIMLRHRID